MRITNERSYRIAKARVEGAEQAIARSAAQTDKPPRLQQVMTDGLRGNLDTLKAEIAEYEALRSGRVRLEATNLKELPMVLIKARVARQWTQRQLAEQLGLPEQQVQRWERHEYHGVTLENLIDVAKALGVRVAVASS